MVVNSNGENYLNDVNPAIGAGVVRVVSTRLLSKRKAIYEFYALAAMDDNISNTYEPNHANKSSLFVRFKQ